MPEPTATAEALNDLRQRYLAGGEWTRDELKNAIHTMIGQRLKDVQAAAVPKTKKGKATVLSLDDMLPGPEKSKLDQRVDAIMDLGRALDKIEPKKAIAAPIAEPKKPASNDGFF